MPDRIEALRAIVSDDPANAFARYGLAMEFAKSGQEQAAIDEFCALIEQDQDYCAAYFHAGQTLERIGDLEAAAEMYQHGIEAAVRTGDQHTRGELQAALDLLPR